MGGKLADRLPFIVFIKLGNSYCESVALKQNRVKSCATIKLIKILNNFMSNNFHTHTFVKQVYYENETSLSHKV